MAKMSYAQIPKEEIELFKQLPDLKVIVDVGSRDDTDYYDIYPNAEYHLFEPNLEFVAKLEEKVGDKPNVYINAVGVGYTDGIGKYSVGVQGFIGGEARVSSTEYEYRIINLDRYVRENKLENIDFLKVDVEGYDFKVLLGAPVAIGRSRFIQYEYWDDKKEFHALLGEQFDMEYVGYRNVLCMNKTLVDVKTRNTIRQYIAENKLWELH